MRDFQRGVVYALKAADGRLLYIGSTTQSLEDRWADHVKTYRKEGARYPGRKLFQFFATVDLATVTIEPLEAVPCASYDELLDAERRHILQNATHIHGCNQRIAGGRPGSAHVKERAKRLAYHKAYHRRLLEARAHVIAP